MARGAWPCEPHTKQSAHAFFVRLLLLLCIPSLPMRRNHNLGCPHFSYTLIWLAPGETVRARIAPTPSSLFFFLLSLFFLNALSAFHLFPYLLNANSPQHCARSTPPSSSSCDPRSSPVKYVTFHHMTLPCSSLTSFSTCSPSTVSSCCISRVWQVNHNPN